MTPIDAPNLDDATPLCPACGYDLRGIGSARCPECGLDVATLGAATSAIPWANRRQTGRARAWARTVWRFTVLSRWVARETARPVSVADARRFWLVTATLLSLLPVGLFAARLRREGGPGFVFDEVLPTQTGAFGIGPTLAATPDWLAFDVMLPWATGFALPGVAVATLWLATVFVTGVHTYLFHPRGLDRRAADRATAIAYYLVAPLVPPAAVAAVLLMLAAFEPDLLHGDGTLAIWLSEEIESMRIAWAIAAILAINAVVRMLVALRLTTRAGVGYVAIAAAFLPLLWVAAAAVPLVVVPWALGVIRFAIDGMG